MKEKNLPCLAKTAQALREGIHATALLKVFLRKDDSDDEEDDGEEDDGYTDNSDDNNADGGHYNSDEHRIPAGQSGAVQWKREEA